MMIFFSRLTLFLSLLFLLWPSGAFSYHTQRFLPLMVDNLLPPMKLKASYETHPSVIELAWQHDLIEKYGEELSFLIYRAEENDTTEMREIGKKLRKGRFRDELKRSEVTLKVKEGSIRRNKDYYYAVKAQMPRQSDSPFSNIAKGRLKSVALGNPELDSTALSRDSIKINPDSIKIKKE